MIKTTASFYFLYFQFHNIRNETQTILKKVYLAKQSIASKKDWSGLSKGDVEQREFFVHNLFFVLNLNLP